jgi:hypothetical protein
LKGGFMDREIDRNKFVELAEKRVSKAIKDMEPFLLISTGSHM